MIKIILFFILLSSCNFTPIYSNENLEKTELWNNINFIYDNRGLNLAQKIILNNLLSQLTKYKDSNNSYKYSLHITNIREDITPANIGRAGDITEYNYKISLNINVTKGTRDIFDKEFVNSVNYNVDNDYYKNHIAIKKLRNDISRRISDDIENSLNLYLSSKLIN